MLGRCRWKSCSLSSDSPNNKSARLLEEAQFGSGDGHFGMKKTLKGRLERDSVEKARQRMYH